MNTTILAVSKSQRMHLLTPNRPGSRLHRESKRNLESATDRLRKTWIFRRWAWLGSIFILFVVTVATSTIVANTGETSSGAPAAAAEAGKDVVHQLNSAFTKVFESVAPSVVIVEISKKAEAEGSGFDD